MSRSDLDLVVTSRAKAAGYLMASKRRSQFSWVVSIGTPPGSLAQNAHKPPAGFGAFRGPKLRLVFDDVESEISARTPPTREQVEALIVFLGAVSGRGLVHCLGGVSRSTAAALVRLAMVMGPGSEHEAALLLPTLCDEWPMPNRLVIRLADRILGCNGNLIAAAQTLHVLWERKPVLRAMSKIDRRSPR